jgi:hypothetical protein
LRLWRERKKLSRTDVALLAGVGYSAIQWCEVGLANRPPGALLKLVAQYDGEAAAQAFANSYAEWRRERAATVEQRMV